MRKIPSLRPRGSLKKADVFTQKHQADLVFFGAVVLLCLFGLLMVYDSSQVEALQDFGDKFYSIKQQSLSFAVGLGLLGFFSIFDYHRLQKLAALALFASLFLLLLVFVPGFGVAAGGAHRWLRVLSFSIQPAEFVKLAAVVYFAQLLQKQVKTTPFLMVTGLITVILGVLQKDLGSAIVFAMISFGIYFICGAPVRYLLGTLLMGAVGFVGFIMTSSYRRHRVLAFLDPFADPQGFSYHISQVLIAIGSGGWFGLGVGQSRQKFAYIPEVSTDSIFSIIGEEFGFLGSLVFIALFVYLIWRAFKIAESAPDNFGRLLAVGLTIWLGVQAAVNLGAMVSLVPLTGVPLPFISFGGSALVANLIAVGILLNISKQGSR